MNGYYGYSGKKSKRKGTRRGVIIRVIIIVAAVVGSVAFALVLGNHLKNKTDSLPKDEVPVEELTTKGEDTSNAEDEDPYTKPARTYAEIEALRGYLDLADCPDAESAAKFVDALKSSGYTGVIFDLKDKNGNFTVAYDSVTELTGAISLGSVASKDIFSAAVTRAVELGMKVSVRARLSDIYANDDLSSIKNTVEKRILFELYGAGVREFVLDGVISEDNFNSRSAAVLYDYVKELRDACPEAVVGIVMQSGIFKNPELTPTLELIYRYSDFFSVDFTDRGTFDSESVSEFLESCKGSFTAYNILSLLPSSNISEIREYYAMFLADGKTNMAFAEQKEDFKPVTNEESGEFDYTASKAVPYSLSEETKDTTDTTDTDDT